MLELAVQREFARGAGLVEAGLVSVVMQAPEFSAAAEKMRKEHSFPLSKGRDRKMSVQLLGGVIMWITWLYCEPVRRRSKDSREVEAVSGLQIEQVQFGLRKKSLPAGRVPCFGSRPSVRP